MSCIYDQEGEREEEREEERERERATQLLAMLQFVVAVDHSHVTSSRLISQSHFDDVILHHHHCHYSLIRLVNSAFHSD